MSQFCGLKTPPNGVFTLPDKDTETETDKKRGCTELCGGVHTAQKQMTTQIPIVVCVLGISLRHGLVVISVNIPKVSLRTEKNLAIAQCERIL